MSHGNDGEPNQESGKFGQTLIKLTVIVGLIGGLGAAISSAIDSWDPVADALSSFSHWWEPDCSDYSKLSKEEIETCQELLN